MLYTIYKRLSRVTILILMMTFSFGFGIACSMGSKRLTALLKPVAKMASMYRLNGDFPGHVKSRYCAEEKKGKCKKYAYDEGNLCSESDWKAFKNARYRLVPVSEL